MQKKAIFLDRDGTINEDIGYLYKTEDLVFIPRAIDAMKILQDEFLLFIITNQQGISQGVFSEADFLDFNRSFLSILEEKGVSITELYFCPHTRQEKCKCRKPNTYFLSLAEKKYSLDLRNSYIIGDHPSDMEVSCNIDIKTIYILSGHGRKHLKELKIKPDYITDDLYEAAIKVKTINRYEEDG